MADLWDSRAKLAIRAAVSFVVLGAGLFVILSGKYPPEDAKWAAGIIGVVIGYWLR